MRYVFVLVFYSMLCNAVEGQNVDTIKVSLMGPIIASYTATTCSGAVCPLQLQIVIPPAFTITDVHSSFNYRALGICSMNEGAFSVSIGACQTRCNTCGISLPGLCLLGDQSIFDSVKTCLPSSSCSNDTIVFNLNFIRGRDPAAGCDTSCIIGDNSWDVRVMGYQNICLGVNESKAYDFFIIYPNPANDVIAIHRSYAHFTDPVTVSVRNVLGEVIRKESILAVDAAIDIKALTSGLYFVEVDNKAVRSIGKFVKE